MCGQQSKIAETRLEALEALALILLQEVNALTEISGPQWRPTNNNAIDLKKEMTAIETGMIKWALMRTSGNQAAAAKLLLINRTTLHEKMKRYRIKAIVPFQTSD